MKKNIKTTEFEVSVVIPVYNAEEYIEKAVESALLQNQTKEIIIIEDASQDSSLKICKKLERKTGKIKLLQNPTNYGASVSRNIGIDHTTSTYISFLDADDYYLPGFFDKAELLFHNNQDADAVFGTIGTHFYNNLFKEKYFELFNNETTGMDINYHPDSGNLFSFLLQSKHGHFSIIGTVFKRSSLESIGNFDENLKQSQDTDLLWRFSLLKKMYAIPIDQLVAMRGVHEKNRVLNTQNHEFYYYLLLKKWVEQIVTFKIKAPTSRLLLIKYLRYHPTVYKAKHSYFLTILLKLYLASKLFFKRPKTILNII
jgi:glycosyltransferase involved in cell wall biosynthesis